MIRGTNCKILQEINRNIAKLSTSVNTTHHLVSTKVDYPIGTNKSAVANVLSHHDKSAESQSRKSITKDCELESSEHFKNDEKNNTTEGNALTIRLSL